RGFLLKGSGGGRRLRLPAAVRGAQLLYGQAGGGMMPLHLRARVTNMTRETKLGLGVSCSFLCLLGAGVGLKLTEPPEGDPGSAADGRGWAAVGVGKNERTAERGPAQPGEAPPVESVERSQTENVSGRKLEAVPPRKDLGLLLIRGTEPNPETGTVPRPAQDAA